MSTANPSSAPPHPTPKTSTSPTASPETLDRALALSLHLWPALTLAVQNNWGGASSSDKRSWFAGALSDLFVDRPDTDAADLEEVLLQVMLDEFEVVVDDGSAGDVAEEIMRVRRELLVKGDGAGGLEALEGKWLARKGKKIEGNYTRVERAEEDDDTDWDDDEDEDGESDGDEDMGEAPPLPVEPARKERVEPEVDEDGFTKVVRKAKR